MRRYCSAFCSKRYGFCSSRLALFGSTVFTTRVLQQPACPVRLDRFQDARFDFPPVTALCPAAQLLALKQCKHRTARARNGAGGRRKGSCRFQCGGTFGVERKRGSLQCIVYVLCDARKVTRRQRGAQPRRIRAERIGRFVVLFVARGRGNGRIGQKQQHMIPPRRCERLDALAPPRHAGEAAAEHVPRIAAQTVCKRLQRRKILDLV